jgi:hypothetical protein
MQLVVLPFLTSGCFLAHGVDEGAPPKADPAPEPAPMPRPDPPTEPGHDICPSVPDMHERCSCGIAERLWHPDAEGRCFLCHECPASCEVPNPEDGPIFHGARLSWQSAGGAAGAGPAIVVDSDGFVQVWHMTPGFDPDEVPLSPPDEMLALGFPQTDQLFLRLLAADSLRLPHPPSLPGPECHQDLDFRECDGDDCARVRLSFSSAEQVLPELACVGDWFDAMGITNPTTFCAL